ncbi:MAG TPA: methylated-DNA--[protein]-cysteine S-methyltransferase [Anaerolineales bacterium]|nr:methylated-DNA--[protein]-cysteine S-methyltransferase [Anaerolineales bacterium]
MKAAWIGVLEVSPLGPVWVAVTVHGLAEVDIATTRESFVQSLHERGYSPVLVDQGRTAQAVEQLDEYLRGERRAFDLAIDWSVLTPFQQQALRLTSAIPYGQVRTYGEIARQMGKPGAARAVGRAEATNPMPLVIPCHRVLGSDGALHGYGAGEGLKTKEWLLSLEGSNFS